MLFVPTVSRTSGTNFILSPNPTIIIYHIGNGYLHNCHKYNSNNAHALLYLNYVLKIRDNVSVHYYFFLFLFSLMGATPTALCQLFLYPTSQNKHPKPIVHCHESSHCKHHCCYPKILLFILFSETRYHPTNLGRLCCETSGTSVNKICSQVYGSDKTP